MNAEKRNVMLEEIMSEPGYFRECLERREELTGDFVKLFTSHRFRRIYFSGSGSPSHAGLVLKLSLIHISCGCRCCRSGPPWIWKCPR